MVLVVSCNVILMRKINMKAFSWVIVVGLMLGTVAPGLSLAATTNASADVALSAPDKAAVATRKVANASVVNLNTADVTALETIKGLGATKAQAIVNYRQQHGNFASVADVAKVPGIGPKMLVKIQDELTI
jgi:competence protein ComEA